MKNKGIYYTLAIILVAGIAITTCNSYFLKSTSKTETNAAYENTVLTDQEAVSGPDGGALLRGMSGMEETALEEEAEAAPEEAAPGGNAAGGTEGEAPMAFAAARSGDAAPGETAPETAAEDVSGSNGPGQEGLGRSAPGAGAGADGGNTAGSGAGYSAGAGTGGTVGAGPASETGGIPGADGASQKSAASSVSGGTENGAGNGASVESVVISPLETTAENSMDKVSENGMIKEDAAPVSSYRQRLVELDSQIQKSRENLSTSNGNASVKNAASSELKLWDNELNMIYGEIMDRLNETQAAELVKEEREWIKERDRLAAEAAKSSAGDSAESVEYTVSLAQTTRQRAYELVDTYEYLLMD